MLGSVPLWCRNAQAKTQASMTLLARNSLSQLTQVPVAWREHVLPPCGTGSRGSLGNDGCVKAPPVKPAWFLLSSPRPGPNFLKATGQRFIMKSSPGYPKVSAAAALDRTSPALDRERDNGSFATQGVGIPQSFCLLQPMPAVPPLPKHRQGSG